MEVITVDAFIFLFNYYDDDTFQFDKLPAALHKLGPPCIGQRNLDDSNDVPKQCVNFHI